MVGVMPHSEPPGAVEGAEDISVVEDEGERGGFHA